MGDSVSSLIHLIWMVPLLLVAVYLPSPRGQGKILESRAQRLLRSGLPGSSFALFTDFSLNTESGNRVIPLLIVSGNGIFVGRSARYPGRVTATRVLDRWSQHRFGRKHSFDNPLYQADLDIHALRRGLNLNSALFHPFVMFPDQTRFTEERPPGVITASELVSFIRERGEGQLSSDLRRSVVSQLGKLSTDRPVENGTTRRLLVSVLLVGFVLVGGGYIFRVQLFEAWNAVRNTMPSASGVASPDSAGQGLTEQEQWESALVCASSIDTGRCACYEPSGERADLPEEDCVRLAEKGSVLNR